jgi:hypothetical protein
LPCCIATPEEQDEICALVDAILALYAKHGTRCYQAQQSGLANSSGRQTRAWMCSTAGDGGITMRRFGSPHIRRTFAFLQCEARPPELLAPRTAKHLRRRVRRDLRGHSVEETEPVPDSGGWGFSCHGVLALTEEAFCRLCSRSGNFSEGPHRPVLDPGAEARVAGSDFSDGPVTAISYCRYRPAEGRYPDG